MPYRKLLPNRPTTPKGTVYLIHFERPFGHARHYLGFTTDLSERIRQHTMSQCSLLLMRVNAAGINWTLARVWEDVTLRDEYRIKNFGSAKRICPICQEERALNVPIL